MVALKRHEDKLHGVEELRNEVKMLCQLCHPYLISLIGFCHEQNEMILVYEYMSRGSLSDHLFGKTYDQLCWKQRLEICIGVARGLHYLHTGAKRGVIHRDLKCRNILLDDELSSKISNFAFSKMGPPSMSNPRLKTESRIMGTYGYIAPEYVLYGELTEKCDVFSFGVVLFEVLCGRKYYDRELPEPLLLVWVSKFIREGIIYSVIDPYLHGKIAPDCFKKYLEIAYSCIHNNRNKRQDMGEVEITLQLALELQQKADSEMEGINSYGEYMGKIEVTLELALELQEKADSKVEGINSHGECMYKDLSFHPPYDVDEFSSVQDSDSKMELTLELQEKFM